MREILFRGKRRDNGEWVYGSLQVFKGYSIFDKYVWKNFFTVNYQTVGQYTGLLDKEGKKIFEGDIINGRNLLHEDRIIYRVVYEENGFYYCDEDDVAWHPEHIENAEIIGNIYDNPELVEVE